MIRGAVTNSMLSKCPDRRLDGGSIELEIELWGRVRKIEPKLQKQGRSGLDLYFLKCNFLLTVRPLFGRLVGWSVRPIRAGNSTSVLLSERLLDKKILYELRTMN